MQSIKSWLSAITFIAALVATYTIVDLVDRNATLYRQVSAQQSRACPERLNGKTFTFSKYEDVALSRPGYSRLNCFYKRGIAS